MLHQSTLKDKVGKSGLRLSKGTKERKGKKEIDN